jgi:hypothetical protein
MQLVTRGGGSQEFMHMLPQLTSNGVNQIFKEEMENYSCMLEEFGASARSAERSADSSRSAAQSSPNAKRGELPVMSPRDSARKKLAEV